MLQPEFSIFSSLWTVPEAQRLFCLAQVSVEKPGWMARGGTPSYGGPDALREG